MTQTVFYPGMQYGGQGQSVSPGLQGNLIPNANFIPNIPGAGALLKTAAGYIIKGVFNTATEKAGSNLVTGATYPEGASIEIVPGLKKNRRRRRKLLTCGDKADIAFLYGQLGGGQLGRAAISSLLSRRCS